jgi:hypothetical protein
MTEDRTRRLEDWGGYEQEMEIEQTRFRQLEMLRGIRGIAEEQDSSPEPELIVNPNPDPPSADDSSNGSTEQSSSFLMTVDPRFLELRRAEGITEVAVTPSTHQLPGQIINIDRARRALSGEADLRQSHHPPISVFSVIIPSRPSSPELRRNILLPGTEDNSLELSLSRQSTAELEYPNSSLSSDILPPRPTIVYGADATQMLIQGELQEQAPEYLTSPILYPEDRFPGSLNEALALNIECSLAEPPSPTDTEPVDHSIIPARRQLPTPTLRPRHAQDRSLDIDMDYGMQIPLYVQPFVEDHFPSRIGNMHFGIQSFSRLGPYTNRSTPIHLRTYYPYADSKVYFPIPRVDRVAVIDISTMEFPEAPESLTHASSSGRTQIFSLLAPRPPAFEQVLFPGQICPNHCGPMDLPNVTALTIGERFVQLREARFAIISLHSRLREVLPQWLVEELDDPRFTLYSVQGEKLEAKYVDRGNFFRSLHPVFNPLITELEATYFRGAAYAYYRFRQDTIADTIDQVLRSPHYDYQLCRELLELGCLDEYGHDDRAYQFLEQYEDLAKGEDDGGNGGYDRDMQEVN